MKHCNWCDVEFKTDISYQIYCSIECRTQATKEKIAARYIHSRRKKRIGKVRRCKNCNEELSIYNDDALCGLCHVNPSDVSKALKNIKRLANGKE